MKLLLAGLSRFAQRRVLPAASSIAEIEVIDIVSSHAPPDSLRHVAKLGTVHADLSEALAQSDRSLVYVSLVNDEHTNAVRLALEHGHHVVVDKPAFVDTTAAAEIVALAQSSSLVVAEATCYSFHPLFAEIESVIADADTVAAGAVALFTPPVPATDWRHDRTRGGGAVLDTGPYAASVGRVLWGAEPERVELVVDGRAPGGVETSYSLLMSYAGGRTLLGHFGFTRAYQNVLRLMGPGLAIEVERAFSALPGESLDVRVQLGDERHVRRVAPADSMELFLSAVLRAVDKGSRRFDAPLLSDARTLGRLVHAANPPLDTVAPWSP